MKKNIALINGIVFILTLVVNALGAFGLINGLSQKVVSDKYHTLITPGPQTFSIWGVIYTLLIISTLMLVFKKDDYYNKANEKIGLLYLLSSLLNITWIVLFSYEQMVLSSVMIVFLVITLVLILSQLRKIHEGKRFLLGLTFGFYAGWLFIATVVNIAATLVANGVAAFGSQASIWTIAILIIAILLLILVNEKHRNAVFALPVAWAFYGMRFVEVPSKTVTDYPLLKTISIIGVVILIGISAITLYRNHFEIYPKDDRTV